MNDHMHTSGKSVARIMGWALLVCAFLTGCEAAPQASVLHQHPAESTIILPGQAVFAPGSDLITESGRALLDRSLATLPPDAVLSIAIFAEGKRAPRHSRPENRRRLTALQAHTLATYLNAEARIVTASTGNGDAMVNGRPAERRIEIVAVWN